MNGAQLNTYVLRRLAEEGLNLEANRVNELYDYITEGRDEVLAAFALAAPIVVQSAPIALEQPDPVNTPLVWRIPAATKDPFRLLVVRQIDTGAPFTPGGSLNQDAGDYELQTIRQIKFSDDTDPGTPGPEVIIVPHAGDIVAGTTEANIGLPTTCHRAIGKYAAVLALTADEESDATNAMALFGRELERLERIYGDYDMMGGGALRGILMHSLGEQVGEHTY